MMADDALLLAYVDGELSREERDAVETQLRESAEAREKVALLRTSQVNYAEAFARQPLPPLPESLRMSVEEMVRAHQPASANDATMEPQTQAPSAPVRSRMRGVPVWLAAACVAGAFVAGQFLHLDALPGLGSPGAGGGSPQVASASSMSPWVQAAIGYQALYTRDTVAYRQDDPAVAEKTIGDIRSADGLALRVPDLSSAGLTFKTVQRLRFNNKPLVQIVYLPRSGPPVALCVMKEPKPDQAVASHTVGQMDVATWRQAELSYALIGQSGQVNLAELGKHIANFGTAQLFGDASQAVPSRAG
jgi:anti-sigma factor RsiW